MLKHSHFRVASADVEAFVGYDEACMSKCEYLYGGSKSVSHATSDQDVLTHLERLKTDESGLKNTLINRVNSEQAFHDDIRAQLPSGYLGSTVGPARCLLRPRAPKTQQVLENPHHPDFESTMRSIFEPLGEQLNKLGGKIKLTPDFGRYAKVSDWLADYTPHVLGISCEKGGCGGKSSFSATGIVAGLVASGLPFPKPVTIIGADGALGRDVVGHFQRCHVDDLAVCDLTYDRGGSEPPPGCTVLPAKDGMFTGACLRRGGTIIATTVGCELEHSNWAVMPTGTLLLLAHNLAIPRGNIGIQLMRGLAARCIVALPGQPLTLGGSLTSRLEWYFRQANPGKPFGPEMKALAHEIVRCVCGFLAAKTLTIAGEKDLTPFEAMLEYAR